jgi:hypothetical protein
VIGRLLCTVGWHAWSVTRVQTFTYFTRVLVYERCQRPDCPAKRTALRPPIRPGGTHL